MFLWNLEYILVISLWAVLPFTHTLNCGKCERGFGKIICPGSLDENRFEVQVFDFGGAFQSGFGIVCRHKSQTVDFSLIADCSFNEVTYVEFQRCPLPNVSFSEIFEQIGIHPKNVTTFSFSNIHSREEELKEWHLNGLENLVSLEFKDNGFTSVPLSIFENTPNLKNLMFTGNRIHTLPDSLFSKLPNLTRLELNNNELEVLPNGLFTHLHNLQNLSLWTNHLREFKPELLNDVTRLWSLQLSYNKISQLDPNVFAGLKSVRKILIDSNRLESLPESLFHGCPLLETLTFNNNMIKHLPGELFRESKIMQTLEFSMNEISQLPPRLFENMKDLVKLKLKRNSIKKLPSEIFWGLVKLEVLDLQSNLIEYLPPQIFDDLIRLDTLALKNNSLSELPDKIFKNCEALEKLYLSVNKLTTLLPTMFPNPSVITMLHLDNNNLSFPSSSFEIPPGPEHVTVQELFPLAHLTILTELHLKNNIIRAMPQALNSLFQNLTLLDLENNLISHLDHNDLTFKSDYIKIDFSNNEIKSINLNNMNYSSDRKTVEIYVKGNPLLCDCELYNFANVVQGKLTQREANGIEVKGAKSVNCLYPEEPQRWSSILDVDAESLTCKSQECASNCSCSTRSHDHMFMVDCAYQSLQSIPKLKAVYLPSDRNYSLTLNLRNNSIASLKGLDDEMYKSLVNLTMPFNKLDFINQTVLPDSLRVLDIRGNNISSLSTETLKFLNSTNMILSLGNNPWKCDCSKSELHTFVRDPDRQVKDIHNVQCSNFNNEPLINLTEEELCPLIQQPMVIISIASTAVFLLLFAVLGTVSFYKYKQDIKVWLFTHGFCLWAVAEEEKDVDKKYDAFISYSDKDEEFVNSVLVPGLESGEPRYKVCLHYRDWDPGEDKQNQIDQSVEASRRTIVVLSSNFIEHVWGHIEFKTAHSKALKDRTNRIIVIVLGEVPPENELDEELKLYISTRTYLQQSDSKFWEKLRYAMPHPQDLLRKRNWKQREADKLELVKTHGKPTT